jgi:hypothetical protein
MDLLKKMLFISLTAKMTLHLNADGPALAMISVSLLSNAFKSSQATCSMEDIVQEIFRLWLPIFAPEITKIPH